MDDDDAAVIACLDSVDAVLRLRDELNTQLSEGWMEMARARYSMGHSRISESLYSLTTHSSVVSVSGGVLETNACSNGAKQQDEIAGEAPTRAVDPLRWFGGIVSPHLRASQQCFQRALRTVVQIGNVQSKSAHLIRLQ